MEKRASYLPDCLTFNDFGVYCGYVEGRNYIKPAIQPVFDTIAGEAWKKASGDICAYFLTQIDFAFRDETCTGTFVERT